MHTRSIDRLKDAGKSNIETHSTETSGPVCYLPQQPIRQLIDSIKGLADSPTKFWCRPQVAGRAPALIISICCPRLIGNLLNRP
jgi:hypothetical protein